MTRKKQKDKHVCLSADQYKLDYISVMYLCILAVCEQDMYIYIYIYCAINVWNVINMHMKGRLG